MAPGLYTLFNSVYPLPESFWKELNDSVEERDLAKKSILLKIGSVCNEIHFLVSGLARAYYIKDDEEVTSWFMKENDVIISVQSFFRQTPSAECIELLEASRVISLHYDLLQKLYKKYPEFNFVGRVLTEHYYVLSEERAQSLRMQTAKERYEILMATHPGILLRAPLKYVASYLGMKPETLSRMRAQLP